MPTFVIATFDCPYTNNKIYCLIVFVTLGPLCHA